MKAPRTVAALSLGLVGFAFAGCGKEGKLRPVEPRLSNGIAYAPCPIHQASSDLIPAVVCGVSRAQENAHRPGAGEPAVRGGKVPESLEEEDGGTELGARLSTGTSDELNRLLDRLEKSAGGDPHNARIWSDLAAARLVRAQRAEDPRDLLRAYEAADRAVQEDGSLPEARFNRALILKRLFLVPQAAAAWQDYLKLDGTSDWAGEVRDHLATAARPQARSLWDQQRRRLDQVALAGDAKAVEAIVGEYRQAAREYAEQDLFGLWADAILKGRQGLAADRLRILRSVGDALVKIDGERLVHDSVAAIDALAGGPPERWRDLVKGYRDFGQGYAAYHARKSDLGMPKLAAARDALVRAGSPLAFRAKFVLVCCDYINHRNVQALAGAEPLAREVEKLPYAALRGHVLRVKGTLESILERMQAAADDYAGAQKEFEQLREDENLSAVLGLEGENLIHLGRRQQAWQSIYKALRATPKLRDPGALANIFMIAANAALREGAEDAALAFQQERVRHALESNALAAVEALTGLAQAQEGGERESALATLGEAGRQADLLDDPQQRRHRKADLGMIEGTLLAQKDPSQAVGLLTSALAVYEEDQNSFFSLWTLLARGRAQRAAGDAFAAERDFTAALTLYERMGRKVDRESLRLSLLEETDSVFDELVSLQADRDPDHAFASVDRARSRVLPGSESSLWSGSAKELDRLRAEEPRPLSLEEISRRLPTGTTLVQFSVLEDRVLIWHLRKGKEGRFLVSGVRRRDLDDAVARLQRFGRPGWDAASAELFDLLVRPWLDGVPPDERIVLVPDKALHRVPFAALRDHSTGRFLIESHPLAVTPSATLYLKALSRQAGAKWTAPARGLVIGEPAIDHGTFFDLSSLPASAAEASRLAARTGAWRLEGNAAVKSAILKAAKEADWIHFSGHSLVDPRNTLLSKLVLAPETEGDPGVLTAEEVYSLRLDGTRLVVLAACETGNEYIPGSEGVTSLARAFLAARVPTVVASLWSVDDRATADLFDAFYRFLLAGDDPVDALRKAQRGMLHGDKPADRPPQAWAAFEVIGASAE